MAQVVSKKCGVCEENNSKLLCYECNQELCEMCRPVHDKFSANKQHTIVDNRDITCINYAEKLKCKTHDQESRCFCLTCSSLICAECIIDEHKSHDVKSIKTMAYDYRMDLSKTESKVKSEMEMLLNLKTRIKNKKKTLSEAFNLIERDLKSSIDYVQNIVKGVADEYIVRTKTHLIKQEEIGNSELQQVETTENGYKTFIKTLAELKKEKHDGSFVTRFKWMQDDMENLKEMPSVQSEEGFKSFERNTFLSTISNANTQDFKAKYKSFKDLEDQIKEANDLSQSFAEENERILKLLKLPEQKTKMKIKEERKQKEDLQKKVDELSQMCDKYKVAYQKTKQTQDERLAMQRPQTAPSKQYREMQVMVETLKGEKESLMQRLSKVAGMKMKNNNPAIADLSDPNRPEKLSEKFREIYDNAWTSLLDTITERTGESDDIGVKQIVSALMYAGGKEGHDPVLKTLKDLIQVSVTRQSVAVKKNIKEFPEIKTILQVGGKNGEAFITECLQLCLYMCTQDPPVVLDFSCKSGDAFNKDKFTPFTQFGAIVDYVVWPVMYLSDNGAIMSKGIAQGK